MSRVPPGPGVDAAVATMHQGQVLSWPPALRISYYPVINIHHYIYVFLWCLNIICCIYAGPLLLCVRHQGHHRQLYHFIDYLAIL